MKLIILIQDDNGMVWAEEDKNLVEMVTYDNKKYRKVYTLQSKVDLNEIINRANKHMSDFHE
jgi:hypothetical protein